MRIFAKNILPETRLPGIHYQKPLLMLNPSNFGCVLFDQKTTREAIYQRFHDSSSFWHDTSAGSAWQTDRQTDMPTLAINVLCIAVLYTEAL